MAVESVEYKRYGPNSVELTVVDGGDTMQRRIEIPDPLPTEYPTKKEFVKAQATRMAQVLRNRRAEKAAKAAQWDEANVTNQTADAAEFLSELQTEMP